MTAPCSYVPWDRNAAGTQPRRRAALCRGQELQPPGARQPLHLLLEHLPTLYRMRPLEQGWGAHFDIYVQKFINLCINCVHL